MNNLIISKSGILFDLFHTLCSIELSTDIKPPESWQIMKIDQDLWNNEWQALTQDRILGKIHDVSLAIKNIARSIDPTISQNLIKEACITRESKFKQAIIKIDENVIEVLQNLRKKGYKLALVSNADKMEIAYWSESPIITLFDTVVFSCDIGYAKPNPEIYLYACQRLNLNPGDCIFIGDGGSDELAGAKRLGISTIQMTGIISKICPEIVDKYANVSDFRINNLAELLINFD